MQNKCLFDQLQKKESQVVKKNVVRTSSKSRAEDIAEMCEELGVRMTVEIDPDQPEDLRALHRIVRRRLQNAPITNAPSRNGKCPCGSGSRYKNCCAKKPPRTRTRLLPMAVDDEHEPSCGLCGNTEKLTRTPCCGRWICDDVDQYVAFSYERNSCWRNHQNQTMCASHHANEHEGKWSECQECREDIEAEWYAYYGTNEYNFEVLTHPPSFEPTHCAQCGDAIRLGHEPMCQSQDGYLCGDCMPEIPDFQGLASKDGDGPEQN